MFRERIRAEYDGFGENFRRIADFVLQHPLDAALMTATEMANHMAVDAATVVRFAQALGYSGFREMIREVRQVVKTEMTISYSATPDAPDDVVLLRSLLENSRHNLALAQARLTEQANAVLPALSNARRIWTVGQGACAHMAALCAAALRGAGLLAEPVAPDLLEAAERLRDAGPGDVVIAFSLEMQEPEAASAVDFAQRHGAKTLALSVSPITAVARAAEMTIDCPTATETGILSLTCLAAMSTALAAAFTARYPERTATAQAGLEQSRQELLGRQTPEAEPPAGSVSHAQRAGSDSIAEGA